jgi:hypothetical protein
MCAECVRESGDENICVECQRTMIGGAGVAAAPVPTSAVPGAPAALDFGEVTIHDDGTVDLSENSGAQARAAPGAAQGKPAVRPTPQAEGIEPNAPAATTPTPVEKTGGGAGPPIAETDTQAPPAGGTSGQLFNAVPYGVLAGVGVYAFWLLTALIRRQWVQTSVLTAGLAIPWALFRGSTVKKKYGRRVYDKAAPASWTALTAEVIMVVLFFCAEVGGYLIVYRGSNLANHFHDFVKAYTKPLDIVQIALGFAIALVLPYLFKRYEGEPVRAIRKRGSGEPGRKAR